MVEREEEMIKRGVKPHNLVGIRQRILTKFLQIVRSPEHNPEIARYEKVSLVRVKIMFLCIAISNHFFVVSSNYQCRFYTPNPAS